MTAGPGSGRAQPDRDSERLRSSVSHPDVLVLVFRPRRHFDHEPTADEVVERALAYRAIEL